MRGMTLLKPGAHWAQPVTHARYVPLTNLLEFVKRHTGYRLCGRSAHSAWSKAVAR